MNKLKVGIPAITIALSSLALTSCNNKKTDITAKTEPKTEVVTQQAPANDTFEKTNKTESKELPLWAKVLITSGCIGLLWSLFHINTKLVEKLKDDPEGAKIYMDMCGDNYSDNPFMGQDF